MHRSTCTSFGWLVLQHSSVPPYVAYPIPLSIPCRPTPPPPNSPIDRPVIPSAGFLDRGRTCATILGTVSAAPSLILQQCRFRNFAGNSTTGGSVPDLVTTRRLPPLPLDSFQQDHLCDTSRVSGLQHERRQGGSYLGSYTFILSRRSPPLSCCDCSHLYTCWTVSNIIYQTLYTQHLCDHGLLHILPSHGYIDKINWFMHEAVTRGHAAVGPQQSRSWFADGK